MTQVRWKFTFGHLQSKEVPDSDGRQKWRPVWHVTTKNGYCQNVRVSYNNHRSSSPRIIAGIYSTDDKRPLQLSSIHPKFLTPASVAAPFHFLFSFLLPLCPSRFQFHSVREVVIASVRFSFFFFFFFFFFFRREIGESISWSVIVGGADNLHCW